MFDLINEIGVNTAVRPIPPIPTSISERRGIIEDITNELYAWIVPEHASHYNLPRYSDYMREHIYVELRQCLDPGAAATNYYKDPSLFGPMHQFIIENLSDNRFDHTKLLIPPIWLIDSNEIPEQFQFSDISDPRLDNLELLQQYSDWICEKTEFPREQMPPICKQSIQNYLLFLQDREKAKKAIVFILLHELGHVYNNDIKDPGIIHFLSSIASMIFSLSWTICVATAIVLPVAGLVWPVLAAIPLVITAAYVSYLVVQYFGTWSLQRNAEYKADEIAARQYHHAIEGATYTFETLGRDEPWLDVSHPSNSKRIAAMQALETRWNQNPTLSPQPV